MVSIYLSVHLESDLSCFPVAAHQYKAVAEIFLILYDPSPQGGHLDYRNLTSVEDQALQICGSAWTNLDEAARVNAFGPMAFCESSLCELSLIRPGGRYLRNKGHRNALELLLRECSLPTGWPIADIIRDLRDHWASN
jgi:hypothetical protein